MSRLTDANCGDLQMTTRCAVALLVASVKCTAMGQTPTPEGEAVTRLRRFSTNIQFHQDGAVRLVRLSKPSVTDDHLRELQAFPRLEYLAVVCPQVTDAGIANVAGRSRLQTLVLNATGLSSAGLSAVAGLPALERLYLERTAVDDSALEHLAGLSKLKVLSLVGTQVSDAGLSTIAQLEGLEVLRLDDTRVTTAGLAHLESLHQLKTLSLTNCRIGNGIAAVLRLPQLQSLCLNGTDVTDDLFDNVPAESDLRTLEVYETQVTNNAVVQHSKANTQCKVFFTRQRCDAAAKPATVRQGQSDVPPEPILPPIHARLADADVVPDFQRHVIPLLGRLGCNGRSCHGSFQGKGGFRLSMFGYDFANDHANLLQRLDANDVDESLILNKPTSAETHEGGERLPRSGWEWELMRRWVEAGAPGRAADARLFERLLVTPEEFSAASSGESVQLRVTAQWSDGTREDVTALSRFETKNDGVAVVSAQGRVTSVGAGDTHIIVYYDNGIVPVPIIHPGSDRLGDAYPRITATSQLDELVNDKLRQLGIVPSDVADDATFLRRVSLDVAGTLPTPHEIRQFTIDTSPDKRARKVEELLERPAYTAWWTNLLCDLTGSNAGYLGGTEMAQPTAAQWRAWIELRVRENVGWDDIARGIVTATSRRPGQTYADYAAEQSTYTRPRDEGFAAFGNSMPHFWYRDNITRPEDKALAFGYTFMGVRLDCAQCHKHPFDQWSKSDFEQFTKFFVRIKKGQAPDAVEWHAGLRTMLGVPTILNTAALRRQSYLRIAAEGRTIPWNEVYVDPPSDTPQLAKLLGGREVDLSQYDDPRVPLFEWLLTEPNHYFAKSFVNRVWAHYFNIGIIDPPDDLNLANPPGNKRLLDYLTRGFIDSGYDMKWLHRIVTTSDTYQRSWRPNATNREDERNFSRAVVRRLPAEVAIDAVIQSTANDAMLVRLADTVDKRKITQHPKSYQTRSIDYSLLVFGKPLRTTNCDCERQDMPTLVQALYLRNDSETLKLLDRPDGWLQQLARDADIENEPASKWIEETYLRVLSRDPSAQELADCQQHLAAADSMIDGLRDLLWSLLNTQEFITNH